MALGNDRTGRVSDGDLRKPDCRGIDGGGAEPPSVIELEEKLSDLDRYPSLRCARGRADLLAGSTRHRGTSVNDDILPERPGRPPLVSTSGTVEQLTQPSPVELQEKLRAQAAALPGVRIMPSFVCVPGTHACHLIPELAHGPVEAFFAGTEFAHMHPAYDGSLHLMLPPATVSAVVSSGWGLASTPLASVLVYGPRDEWESGVVWKLVMAAYRYAREAPGSEPEAEKPVR